MKNTDSVIFDILRDTPPTDWPALVMLWKDGEPGRQFSLPPVKSRPTMDEAVKELDRIIEQAARLRGYLEMRYGSGCGDQGHADAVKDSNRLAAKVRKVLGYTIPRQDINF